MSVENILKEYDKEFPRFESCRKSTESLILEILADHDLKIHKLESRVKTKTSLEKKLNNKLDKYNSISEITDIVAFRIITYFEDEVDKISDVIKKEFDIDEKNSIDKRQKDSDKFGYQSLHHVFTYTKGRTDFLEYKRFKELKCEIQIRSILQHAWAEIEHDIGYKSEKETPAHLRRNFSRTAALLETADLEFVRIRDTSSEYKEEVKEKLNTNPENVLIDKESLISYIEHNKKIRAIDKYIAQEMKGLLYLPDDISFELNRLNYFHINTIAELDKLVSDNTSLIKKFVTLWVKKYSNDIGQVQRGITVFYLGYILCSKERKKEYIIDYLLQSEIIVDSTQETAEEILSTYNKIITPTP